MKTFTNFKGTIPRLAAKLLPEGFAQTAENCDFRTGQLKALVGLSAGVAKDNLTRTIFTFDGSTWVTLTTEESIIKAQIPDGADADRRILRTNGDGRPVQASARMNGGLDATDVEIGIDAPDDTDPLAVTLQGDPADSAITIHTAADWTSAGSQILTKAAHGLVGLAKIGDIVTIDSPTNSDDGVYTLIDIDTNTIAIDQALTGTDTITVTITRQMATAVAATVSYVYTKVRKWLVNGGDTWASAVDSNVLTKATHGLSDALSIGARVVVDSPTAADDGIYTVLDFDANTITINEALSAVETTVSVDIIINEEESAPSTPTAVTDVYEGQGVVLSAIPTNWDPPAGDTGIISHHYRIYRLAAGSTGAEYQYLAEVSDGTTTYNDYQTIGDSAYELNSVGSSVIETEDWVPPPKGLKGLTQFSNGMLIGFKGNKLYVSEPFVYYAYPVAYTLTFDHDIVAVGVFNESIVIATEVYPYIVTGLDPQSLTQTILPYKQGCVSEHGLCVTNIGVIYPSPDGLFLIAGTEGRIITEHIYTKEQWAALTPANLISFYYDDQYYGFFAGGHAGIVFNFKDEPFVVDIDLTNADVYAGFLYAPDDTLYLFDDNADKIRTWAGGSALTYTWKSGKIRLPHLSNFSCGSVIADAEVAYCKIYGDGVLKHTEATIATSQSNMFRLPGGSRYKNLEIELSGTATIDSITVAGSPSELH